MRAGAGPARDWSAARRKIDSEGRCRSCDAAGVKLDAAHVIGRRYDSEGPDGVLVVDPLDVVPLCRDCHRLYDSGTLDLLRSLSRAEQAQAVAHVGIVGAYRRTTGRRLP